MRRSLISDPTEHFSKLIYAAEEKSFSIDLVSRVEIVIPILKNCLVGHDISKWRILFLELKSVAKVRCPRKRIFKAARDESYFIWSTWKKS